MNKILIISLIIVVTFSFFIRKDLIKQYTSTTVNFIGKYPQQKIKNSNISIRGDNCNLTWKKGIPLNKNNTDTWTTSLLCQQNKKISVKLLVNDTHWMMGENFIFYAKSGMIVYIFPSFDPKINSIVDTAPLKSKILENSRKLSVYLPPSYYDNPYKKYQVLLMHDGQNLFDPAKAAFGTAWLCQNTTNTLIVQGKIKQIIIVGIWNTNERNNQYTYSYDPQYKFGGKGDLYLDFIQKQLIPHIQNQILKGRIINENGYSIGGSSLGGLISCYGLYTRPKLFNKSICMSSSFWWNSQDFNNKILKNQTYSSSNKIYVDSGDSGNNQDSKNQTIRVFNKFKTIGYKQYQNLFYYLDKGGQHNEYYWGHRFGIPLTYLFSSDT